MEQIKESLTLFLIGVTGDLAKKKIVKAVYRLFEEKRLPSEFHFVGIARTPFSRAAFHEFLHEIVHPADPETWQKFCQGVEYVAGDVSELSTFERIAELHCSFESCGNHLWYIATLPQLYLSCIENLTQSGLSKSSCGWTKVLIEKPFGTDLETAYQLNTALLKGFSEEEIYRIDHFLAKETVQNLLAFRFANGVFENLWNHNFIDHIQITSSETMGVTGRGVFYDQTGTVRDLFQNHILQMIAMTLMEEPQSLTAHAIDLRRQELLSHMKPLTNTTAERMTAFGQYLSGDIDGETVVGYLDEPGVAPNSKTETAFAAKLTVECERWQGVPIYVRTGKRIAQAVTEISLQFKEPLNTIFGKSSNQGMGNILTIRIAPNEGIIFRLMIKKPGLEMALQQVPMQFCYKNVFQMDLLEAYVKLLYDAVQGDATLFPHARGIEHAWKLVMPVLALKDEADFHPEPYAAGSWGPQSFTELLARDGKSWIEPSTAVCEV